MKEKFLEEKEMDFNYNLLSRYLDPKTLFELLSISNENIGQLSLCKNQISTEETKEDICFSFGEEIRSGIFESYYLIEGIYNKKEGSQSSKLSNNKLFAINAEKAVYRSYSNNKAEVKEPDVREKVFANNILKENDDLPDNDSINHHDNAWEIEDSNITLNSAEQNEILESYFRYLKINSTLIVNNGFKGIEVHQILNYWLVKKNTPYEPKTDITIKAPNCEHYEEGTKESFYYLPEISIKLGFKHRFHKTYFFCTKYVPLFKFDLGMILEIFNGLQSGASSKYFERFNALNMELKNPIVYVKSQRSDIRAGCFVLIQNEILMNGIEWGGSLSKITDSYDIKKILSKFINNKEDLNIIDNENYWIPTLNYCEKHPKFIQNTLKIEILEYIIEKWFPTYWRDKQVGSTSEEIIEFLQKDYVHKELEPNFKNIGISTDAISSQKEEDGCFSVNAPNRQIILNSKNKSKDESINKHPYSYEESLQPSSNILSKVSKVLENLHKETTPSKYFSSKEGLNQEKEIDGQSDENNYECKEHESLHRTSDFKIEETSNSQSCFSEIKTSVNNSKSINESPQCNLSSLTSKSK